MGSEAAEGECGSTDWREWEGDPATFGPKWQVILVGHDSEDLDVPEDVRLLQEKYREEVQRYGDEVIPRPNGPKVRMEMVISAEYQAVAEMLVVYRALHLGNPEKEQVEARIALLSNPTRRLGDFEFDLKSWVPRLKEAADGRDVSLRDLATHAPSIRGVWGDEFRLENLEATLRDWLEAKNLPITVFGVASPYPEPQNKASSEWAEWRGKEDARLRENDRALVGKSWENFERTWPEHVRATPNPLLRAGVFGIGEKRRYVEDKVLPSFGHIKAKFTGLELKEYDLKVFLQLLHIQGGEATTVMIKGEEWVRFRQQDFLCAIGVMTKSGPNNSNLDKALTRLKAGALELAIRCKDKHSGEEYTFKYQGSLILRRAKFRGGHLVQLDPMIRRFFESGYTMLDWAKRQSYRGDITRWLYDYVRSGGYPIKLEKLQDLMGSERRLNAFRADIKKSMAELAATGEILPSPNYLPDDVLTYESTITNRDVLNGKAA